MIAPGSFSECHGQLRLDPSFVQPMHPAAVHRHVSVLEQPQVHAVRSGLPAVSAF